VPYGLRGVRAAYFNLTSCRRAHVRRSCSPIVLSLFLSYIHLEAQSPPVPPECRKVARTSKHSPNLCGKKIQVKKYVSNSHDAINSCLRLAVISPPYNCIFAFSTLAWATVLVKPVFSFVSFGRLFALFSLNQS
jgi:hypothetical protein